MSLLETYCSDYYTRNINVMFYYFVLRTTILCYKNNNTFIDKRKNKETVVGVGTILYGSFFSNCGNHKKLDYRDPF